MCKWSYWTSQHYTRIWTQSTNTIWTDAAAARGLALRSGSGALKHMETKYLSLQQKENNQELRIEKNRGTVNPKDFMTKQRFNGKRLVTLCELLNIKRVDDRSSSAPKLMVDTDYVKSIPPTTENWLRKLYLQPEQNTSTEDKHDTNYINNKYNDTNTDEHALRARSLRRHTLMMCHTHHPAEVLSPVMSSM